MDNFKKEFLEDLRKERRTFADMVKFCADGLILNNHIIQELEKKGFYFETYCGDFFKYYNEEGEEITREQYEKFADEGIDASEDVAEIYQYYIIDGEAADRFAEYTNELVIFNEDLDLFLLCVTHFGTAWEGVSANWKDLKTIE